MGLCVESCGDQDRPVGSQIRYRILFEKKGGGVRLWMKRAAPLDGPVFTGAVAALLLLALNACGGAPQEIGSLEVGILLSEIEGVAPVPHAELVRLEGGHPCAFHTLERRERPAPGRAFYVAENLPPGRYRVRAAWAEYLFTQGFPGLMEAWARLRPLPERTVDVEVGAGRQRVDLDLSFDRGLFLRVEGIPQALHHWVRVRVSLNREAKEGYTCLLANLPMVSSGGIKGYFLPLASAGEHEIEITGPAPEWIRAAAGSASSPPGLLEFTFTELRAGSLDLEVFYPSGEPVRGSITLQQVDWNRSFLDPRTGVDMINAGQGRRVAEGIPEGTYRAYFIWHQINGTGEGCGEIGDFEVHGKVHRHIVIHPAVIRYGIRDLEPGTYRVRIRECEVAHVLSERTFTLPSEVEPFSLVFRPGSYLAELMDGEGTVLQSAPIRAAADGEVRVDWR